MTQEELNEIEELRNQWELANTKLSIASNKIKERGSRKDFEDHDRYGLETAKYKDKLVRKVTPLIQEIKRLRIALEGIMFMAKEENTTDHLRAIYEMAHDALGINDFLKRQD